MTQEEWPPDGTMSFIDWVSWLKTTNGGTLQLDDDVLQYAPESVKGNKAIVLELVAKNGLILKHASEPLLWDWDVVLQAVAQNWKVLACSRCSHMKGWDLDGALALVAVRQSWQAFWLLLPQQREFKAVVLEAVRQNWQLLEDVSPRSQEDVDVVFEAVRQDWRALQYAGIGCRDYERIVREAVRQSWVALQYAGTRCRNDERIVGEAVRQSWVALRHASLRLRVNGNILGAARANGIAHGEWHVETQIQQIVSEAVRQDWSVLRFACEEVQGNREILHQAVQRQWTALQFASAALRADRDLVLEAVQQNGQALQLAGESLRNDKQVVLIALKRDALALQWASQRLQSEKEVVVEAVRQTGAALEFAQPELRADREVVVEAVLRAGEAINFAEGPLRHDQDLVLLAARVFEVRGPQSSWGQVVAPRSQVFRKAFCSALAVRGEIAPVVLVTHLSRHESYKIFQCEASLMSGVSFVCHLEDGWLDPMVLRRRRSTLQDLAGKLLQEVPKHTEVWGLKRVFISIAAGDDREGVAATPWDCDRPLTDFLTTSAGSGRELILPEKGSSDLSDVTLRAIGAQRPMLLHAEMLFRFVKSCCKALAHLAMLSAQWIARHFAELVFTVVFVLLPLLLLYSRPNLFVVSFVVLLWFTCCLGLTSCVLGSLSV